MAKPRGLPRAQPPKPWRLDKENARAIRDKLDESKRCLNRAERSPAEALMHVEEALHILNRALGAAS